jgi:hypothetical protein
MNIASVRPLFIVDVINSVGGLCSTILAHVESNEDIIVMRNLITSDSNRVRFEKIFGPIQFVEREEANEYEEESYFEKNSSPIRFGRPKLMTGLKGRLNTFTQEV